MRQQSPASRRDRRAERDACPRPSGGTRVARCASRPEGGVAPGAPPRLRARVVDAPPLFGKRLLRCTKARAFVAGALTGAIAVALALTLAPAISASAFGQTDAPATPDAPSTRVALDTGQATAGARFAVAGVEETLQLPALPAGCEAAALACALGALGCDIEPTEVVERHLRIDPHWSDAGAFLDDPYDGGGAFPPAVVAAARSVAAARGASVEAVDVSGSSFDALLAHVAAGEPVLAWTTAGCADPRLTEVYVDGYRWYANEHCVVVYGLSADGTRVLVSDPADGLAERDVARFACVYEACGSYAVALRA